MSEATKAELIAALERHLGDVSPGTMVTDWAMVVALTSVEDIGTGRTSFFIEANVNQPIHVTAGLFRYAGEKVLWGGDDDDD